LAEGDADRALHHALADGEDFELAFALSQRQAKRLERECPFACGVTRIGQVVSGRGVRIRLADGSLRPPSGTGYEHALRR